MPSMPIDYKNRDLPIIIAAQSLQILCVAIFIFVPGIALMGVGIYALLGHQLHKVFGFIFLDTCGVGLILLSINSILARVELRSSSVAYKSIFKEKTLAYDEIQEMKMWATKSGWLLRLNSNARWILLGYLTFSFGQLKGIENYLSDKIEMRGR